MPTRAQLFLSAMRKLILFVVAIDKYQETGKEKGNIQYELVKAKLQ